MADLVEGTVKWFNDEKGLDSLSKKVVKMSLYTLAQSTALGDERFTKTEGE